ncbi:MAG: TIGR02391 family protein [Bacteroidetes bacterium]|nr:TIGR02391 family protein [Bacteroidota bacterium]
MADPFPLFEQVVRKAHVFTAARSVPAGGLHPFDQRDIHPKLPPIVKQLFDDGHFAQSTFEAYKFVDKEVQRFACLTESGFKLMMQALAADNPLIRLNPLTTPSEKDEQKGFQFLFAGSVLAIRNPRAHEHSLVDSPDQCLDHLSLASLLLRRLDDAGFK